MSVTRIKEDAQRADEMIAELGRQGTEGGEGENLASTGEPANEPEGGDAAADDQGTAEASSVQEEGENLDNEGDTSRSSDAELKAELEKVEQRYRSLQGMIRKKDEQLSQLHELLAGMQQAQTKAEPQAGAEQDALLTAADSQNFGDDLVDMARRAARQEAQGLQQQLDEIKQQIQGVSKTTKDMVEQSFESKLDQLTENKWRTLDSDPLFITWLGESRYRHGVFQQAVQNQDAATVADFFNQYATEQTKQDEQREAPRNKRREQLQKQVAPGKSRSTNASTAEANEPKEWTRSEIASVYANSKQYSKEEFDKLEREITAAQKAGRVDFSR